MNHFRSEKVLKVAYNMSLKHKLHPFDLSVLLASFNTFKGSMGFLLCFLILGNEPWSWNQRFCGSVSKSHSPLVLLTIPRGDSTGCKVHLLSEYHSFEADWMHWLSFAQQTVSMRRLTVIYGSKPSRRLLLLIFGFWINGESKNQPQILLTECILFKLCVPACK